MTDINPQWRLQMMTEHFGPIGSGWYYEMVDRWTEQGSPLPAVEPSDSAELMCFVSINLYVKQGDEWSKPIFGLGGSKLIEKEKNHFYNNDEGYKMALTDALSVAMKELGVAADIYAGLWDGSKYADAEPKENSPALAGWLDDVEGLRGKTPAQCEKWWTDNKVACKKDLGTALASDVHHAMLAIREAAKEANGAST